MRDALAHSPASAEVFSLLAAQLERVSARFDEQLASDLPPVANLVEHVERYRGKMLRPTLVLLSALASDPHTPARRGEALADAITPQHITAAAVVEMVHMATLVHDDVLDEADVRRRGATINHLHGNEAAVILGDYLIASAYHLCSQIEPASAARSAALAVGRASMTTCAGELLQLHNRENFSLDEPTYFEIIDRKTADLIATSCELGAMLSDAPSSTSPERERRTAPSTAAPDPSRAILSRVGRTLGLAFQIRDDLLDLLGQESSVGKSVGRDIAKGKTTLPVIHHLAALAGRERSRSLTLLEHLSREPDARAERELVEALRSTGSIEHAEQRARTLVDEARALVASLPIPPTHPVRAAWIALADAVVERAS